MHDSYIYPNFPSPSCGGNERFRGLVQVDSQRSLQTAVVKEGFLQFHFVNVFTEAYRLSKLFTKGNVISPAFVVLFLCIMPVFWFIFLLCDRRERVKRTTASLFRLHLLMYGRMANNHLRDAPRYVTLGPASIQEPCLCCTRRHVFVRCVRFLILSMWTRIKGSHTWISVFVPSIEDRIEASRTQRCAILILDVMVRCVDVCFPSLHPYVWL